MKQFLVTLILSAACFAQGGLHSDVAFSATGRPAPGASVRVCDEAATGTPCTPVVTVYSNKTLTTVKSSVTADSSGNFSFYVAPGFYKRQVTSSGSTYTDIIQVANPLNNQVFLDQYGVCDGTTDDATAIQAAITAAANKTLVLPAGKTCATGSQLTISSPTNVLLYGTLKPITTGVSGTAILEITSSNVSIDCGGVGGINGNSKTWSGIEALSTTFLDDVQVKNCYIHDVASASSLALGIALRSVRHGLIDNNRLSTIGVTAATTGGGFGIYTEFNQGTTISNNYSDTVGSTGMNVSSGTGNKIVNNQLLKSTLYALKGGYGLPGSVSADAAASTTSFTVAKNSTTARSYAPGQFVTIVHSATTTCDGYVKTVTDNTTYLTITTSTMGCTPSTGDEVEMPDTGTLIEGNDITWTSADAMDFNISKDITIKNNRIKYAGLYTGSGGALNAINSCIWVGADAQSISPYGTIHPFKSDGVTIEGNHCAHAGGSGIVIFESDNVSIRGNVITYVDEGGFDATTATDPAYGCVEQGRQGFIRHNQISIENNSCFTSVGYSVIANFGRNTTIAGNTGKSPFGMKVDAQIVANVVGNTMQVTAANAFGLRLGDPSGANASSGITLSGNFISCDVVSCTALKQTDAGATGIRDCGANMWEYNGSAQAPVLAVTLGTCSPFTVALKTAVLNGSTSGTVTIAPPAIAGTNTQTLQAATGTVALTTGSAVLLGFCSGVATSSATAPALTLFAAGATAITCTDTSSNLLYPLPSAGTLQNLRCKSSAAGSTAGSGLVTVIKNSAGAALTCTIGTGTTCSDTTHTVSIAAGDTFGITVATGAVETLANVRCTVEKI